MPASLCSTIALTLLLGAALASAQGTLTPPGDPALTMKTLEELEPRIPVNATTTPGDANYEHIISAPGSYYLTGNLLVEKTNGIAIRAAGVTLDLNGFEIARVDDLGGNGIDMDAFVTRCTVKDGSLRGFANAILPSVSSDGFLTDFASGGIYERLSVTQGTAYGIVGGSGWIIRDCSASGVEVGIGALSGSIITRCTTREASSQGIITLSGSIITHSTAESNGLGGMATLGGSVVLDCVSARNAGAGILVQKGSIVARSTAAENSGSGIRIEEGSLVVSCSASRNTGTAGIELHSNSTARDNVCEENESGIRSEDSSNLIDHNHATENAAGIDAASSGALIIRNSATDSTDLNYKINAGHRYGPIIDLTAPGAPAANGSSANETTETTHPWANFAL